MIVASESRGSAEAVTEVKSAIGIVVIKTWSAADVFVDDSNSECKLDKFAPWSASTSCCGWYLDDVYIEDEEVNKHNATVLWFWKWEHKLCIPIPPICLPPDQTLTYDAGVYVKVYKLNEDCICDAQALGQYTYLDTEGICR